MTYNIITEMYHSQSLTQRCTASVASEVVAGAPGDTAVANSWVTQRAWDIAATPGWADQWASAVAGGISDPGANEAVITDAEILSRIQQLMTEFPLDDLLPPPVTP